MPVEDSESHRLELKYGYLFLRQILAQHLSAHEIFLSVFCFCFCFRRFVRTETLWLVSLNLLYFGYIESRFPSVVLGTKYAKRLRRFQQFSWDFIYTRLVRVLHNGIGVIITRSALCPLWSKGVSGSEVG